MSHTAPSSSSHIVEAERAVSPIVVISDPLSTSPHGTVPALRADTAASSVPATATLRVRTDELTRSASSPQEDVSNNKNKFAFKINMLSKNYYLHTQNYIWLDTHFTWQFEVLIRRVCGVV